MKKLFVMLSVWLAVAMFLPHSALALGTITQECQPGTDPERYVFLSHEPNQVFYFAAGTLDAVAIRVKSEIGATTDFHMRVINVTANVGRIVVQKTETATDTAQWLLFDFNDEELQNGFYSIDVVQEAGGEGIWYLGPTDCYEGGAASYDNARHEHEDFRFAVYTSNGSGAQPAAGDDGAADDNADDGSSASQPDGAGVNQPSGDSGSTGSTAANNTGDNPQGNIASNGRTGTGVAYGVNSTVLKDMPSEEDILKMTREAREEDKAFNRGLLSYLGVRIGLVLLFFLILIVLAVLALWLVLRRKKNSSQQETSPASEKPTERPKT